MLLKILKLTKNIVGERFLDEDFEWCDVTIRCNLLSSAISEVLDSMEQNDELDFDNDNE